jgi:outer membrane protein assembly factor BamB
MTESTATRISTAEIAGLLMLGTVGVGMLGSVWLGAGLIFGGAVLALANRSRLARATKGSKARLSGTAKAGMNIQRRPPPWAVVLGAAAGLATSCGGGEPSSVPAGEARACRSGEYPAVGALSIKDGAVEWLVCSPDEAFRTVIGASDDVVLIYEEGSIGRRTIAFDPADGSERWRRSTADTPIPPGPFDGKGIAVLATDDGGKLALVGVDAVKGKEKWRVESSEAPLAHSATVVVVWEAVGRVPVSGSRLRGIDRVTGDELWVSDIRLSDESGVCCANPTAVLGEVVAVPTGATITAIDMRTGSTLWKAPYLDDPTAADGLFVGTRETRETPGTDGPPPRSFAVPALDAASGRELWTARGRASYGGALAIGDGVIVVLSPDAPGLIAYELASGDERWRMAQTQAYAEPQLISGKSLVGLWEGQVSVVSTKNGATIWSATQPFGSPLMNSVGSSGDSVFVAINSLPWGD